MQMPLWKFKREIQRLGMQISQIPWLLSSRFVRYVFDWASSNFVKIDQGTATLQDNIAILLVYQPQGIQASTFYTLRHLIRNGFSPVVVSNAKLSSYDLSALKKNAYCVIQRPNYGYDFGGYRQGILFLAEKGIEPDNLLVLNDSIWFPLSDTCEFLKEVKEQDRDLYGLVTNNRSDDERRHHVQSYMFSFKKRLVASSVFREFWKNLFLSNNKHAVVRQCEIKMTYHFKSRGFLVGSKFKTEDVYDAMSRLSRHELQTVLKYQKSVDPKRSRLISRFETLENLKDFKSLLEERLLGKYFLIAHPLVLLKSLRCPVMKKDRQVIYQLQRKAVFDESLDNELSDVVRREMLMRDHKAADFEPAHNDLIEKARVPDLRSGGSDGRL
ncbi:lipopolysaccharide biosynthesis-like protein [Rhizobium sp. P32RR-XVIII]|uniref:rhamnan synthesis F family protein n=1 Tax=Rhizobium sp. P32RR-XVIII TaxID=2726738 RepID=UPI00183AD06B|nr:rhamnan synthesis F family protein [Rhizobium sp. P32RR-XVIII]NLS08122.1 lipopolysaccharide biosynthesis-like protein [Rhizobium sp. P32RR-XVIII]